MATRVVVMQGGILDILLAINPIPRALSLAWGQVRALIRDSY